MRPLLPGGPSGSYGDSSGPAYASTTGYTNPELKASSDASSRRCRPNTSDRTAPGRRRRHGLVLLGIPPELRAEALILLTAKVGSAADNLLGHRVYVAQDAVSRDRDVPLRRASVGLRK